MSTTPKHESVVLNELWEVEAAWDWGHINILESCSLVELFRRLIQRGDRRCAVLFDSRVAKGAHAKGRSSAKSLAPSLQRAAAYAIAGNLYLMDLLLPGSTRQTHQPDSGHCQSRSILDFLSEFQIAALHSFPGPAVRFHHLSLSLSPLSLDLDFRPLMDLPFWICSLCHPSPPLDFNRGPARC